MASFTAGTTFTDGVANDVTAAKLAALVNAATPTSGLIQDRTAETVIATNDTLLIGDASDSSNLKQITVANLLKAPLVSTSGTVDNLTTGTTTSTAQIVTTGTIATLNSTTGTITTGVIPTLTSTTLITTGTGTAASPAIVPTGDTNTGIFFPAADTIAFSEGGAEAMRIDSSGNVGIGTASPEKKLSVYLNNNGVRLNHDFTTSDYSELSFSCTGAVGNGAGIRSYRASTSFNGNEGDLRFYTNTGSGGASSDGAERLRIDSSGNVGIGTASPLKELQINATEPTIRLEESGAGSKRLELSVNSSAEAKVFATQSGSALLLGTVGTERLRIDSSGNVGIGITPSNQKLDVNGGSVIRGALFLGDGSSSVIRKVTSSTPLTFANQGGSAEMTIDSSGNVGIGTISPGAKFGVSDGTVNIQLSPDSANSRGVIGTAGAHSIAFAPNGTTRLTIDQANGTLTSQPTYDNTAAGSAVVVTSAGLVRRTSSSIKYKKDIENLYGSIVDNAILNLRPVWYRTKNPEGDDKSTWSHVGLIAEEVNSVEPRLVKYKTVEVSIGENGERIETQLENPIPEDVDYAKLSVVLLYEVKAQKAKIASLEARIEALEAA